MNFYFFSQSYYRGLFHLTCSNPRNIWNKKWLTYCSQCVLAVATLLSFLTILVFLAWLSLMLWTFLERKIFKEKKSSQTASVPKNPSEAVWERTMECQHKYCLKWWSMQRTEISVCSKTYKPNLCMIISFGTSF